jgi:hypothetical protein
MTITTSVPLLQRPSSLSYTISDTLCPTASDQASLYRLVLEHGDFGIHKMSITIDVRGQPLATSLYDWETGCIVPAILSVDGSDRRSSDG